MSSKQHPQSAKSFVRILQKYASFHADTIILAGNAGLETKGGSKVKVPFHLRRGDRLKAQTENRNFKWLNST